VSLFSVLTITSDLYHHNVLYFLFSGPMCPGL